MWNKRSLHLAGLSALLLLAACGVSRREFWVTSYPPGADIYRGDEPDPVGATPRRVTVDFSKEEYVPIRVELTRSQEDTRYAPMGQVVTPESKDKVFFFLQRDYSYEVKALLEGIDQKLTRIENK